MSHNLTSSSDQSRSADGFVSATTSVESRAEQIESCEPSPAGASTDSGVAPGAGRVTDEVVQRSRENLEFLEHATAAMLREESGGPAVPLTVIVPAYNEVETIAQVLDRIDEVMPAGTEVIVVDDGSTDGTSQWLSNMTGFPHRRVICRRRNHGKGSAVRLAIRHSLGEVVAIQDADLEYDPIDILNVIEPIVEGRADVVYGSRYLEPETDPSLLHTLGNWVLTRLSNRLTGLNLTDMETCHKAFRGELIRSVPLRERRFGFEPEITAKLAALQARVMEVPTHYDSRGYEDGKKIGWRDGVSALACMWRYRPRGKQRKGSARP